MPWARGQVKQELLKLGWPAEDHAGYTPGTPHEIDLVQDDWHLRDYQQKAIDNFFEGGSGVVVLPCGAGKTLVGAGAMAQADTTTLILVTNTVSARQWRSELLKRTTLTEDEIGEYSGSRQGDQAGHDRDLPDPHGEAEGRVRPPRAARRPRLGPHRLRRGAPAARPGLQADRRAAGPPPARPHRDARARGRPRVRRVLAHRPEAVRRPVEGDRGAGLHLPGLLLRGAHRPARRRAARVRGDRRRRALPARGDRPGEAAGRARPRREARGRAHPGHRPVPRPDRRARRGAATRPSSPARRRSTSASGCTRSSATDAPRCSSSARSRTSRSTCPRRPSPSRSRGSFGSRQEEAQRLGRLLRPKESGLPANFYTLVARDTVDQDFAQNRQRFLAEQGYSTRSSTPTAWAPRR